MCSIVHQAITTGYLSVQAEEQLRQLLATKTYGKSDLNAFMTLQEAAMSGRVTQESRELLSFRKPLGQHLSQLS
ncbi:hypothetical protein HC928_18690 [bacterium]|nr:hypothetical protein [bacterium]